MLLDGDLGLANVDVMLGLQPTYNISHVIAGECVLDDTLVEGPSGIMVIPASSGKRNMAELSGAEHAGLVRAFSELQRPLDTLIVDRSEEHTSELQSLMRISYAVFCLKKKTKNTTIR